MQKNSIIIQAKAINHASYILAKAEKYSSIRNEFYNYIHKNKKLATDKVLYKTVYHYLIEISKRKNLLDEILKTQDILLVGDNKHNLILKNILRILAYILFEQEYTKERPTTKDLYFIIKVLTQLNSNLKKENIKKYLNQLLGFNKSVWEKENYSTSSKQLSLKYFHPQWYIEYFLHYWDISEVEQLLRSNNASKTQWIRIVFPSNINDIDIALFKKKIEYEMQNQEIGLEQDQNFSDIYKVVSIGNTQVVQSEPFKNHALVIQNKASTISAHMLGPAPNDYVLDIAAAPGMKSSILASYLDKTGILISNDISPKRVKLMYKRLGYQNISNANVLVSDGGNNCQLPIKERSMNKVLLDAPCSSTGIIGTYPDHRWHQNPDFNHFSELQKKMFTECLRVLKTGGIGIYSVCSIHYLEGESVINYFLDKITLLDPLWGNTKSCFPATLENEYFSPDILKYCRRLFPHRDQTDGFFFAKFQKK